MYKSNSKFRQRFKEIYTVDLGAGNKFGKTEKKVGNTRKNKIKFTYANREDLKLNSKICIEVNLEKNKNRLKKCNEALERQYKTQKKLNEKIETAWTLDFQEQHKIWLEECNQKISNIECSIIEIQAWIKEDEIKLTKFQQK